MKKTYALICITGALLFMAAVFQPGYRIVLNGQALPGVYDPQLVMRCNTAVTRAAEEITRSHEAPPYTLVPVLCIKHTSTDEQQLWGILLDSYEGVVKLYDISMDGVPIGTVSGLRDVYLMKSKYFPAWSPDTKLTIKETYTYPEAETPPEEVEAVFRRLRSPTAPV